MTWLSRSRSERLSLLRELGLRPRDARQTDLLAQAARVHPVPVNPLVGGWAHPRTLVAHKEHSDKEGVLACETPRKSAYFRVTPEKLAQNPGLKACRKCYNIDGGTA